MQVSNEQIQKILTLRGGAEASSTAADAAQNPNVREGVVAEQVAEYMAGIDEPEFATPPEMVQLLVAKVLAMPDREDRIADLKARIDAGEYNPTSEEIVDAMIRRSIADSIR